MHVFLIFFETKLVEFLLDVVFNGFHIVVGCFFDILHFVSIVE